MCTFNILRSKILTHGSKTFNISVFPILVSSPTCTFDECMVFNNTDMVHVKSVDYTYGTTSVILITENSPREVLVDATHHNCSEKIKGKGIKIIDKSVFFCNNWIFNQISESPGWIFTLHKRHIKISNKRNRGLHFIVEDMATRNIYSFSNGSFVTRASDLKLKLFFPTKKQRKNYMFFLTAYEYDTSLEFESYQYHVCNGSQQEGVITIPNVTNLICKWKIKIHTGQYIVLYFIRNKMQESKEQCYKKDEIHINGENNYQSLHTCVPSFSQKVTIADNIEITYKPGYQLSKILYEIKDLYRTTCANERDDIIQSGDTIKRLIRGLWPCHWMIMTPNDSYVVNITISVNYSVSIYVYDDGNNTVYFRNDTVKMYVSAGPVVHVHIISSYIGPVWIVIKTETLEASHCGGPQFHPLPTINKFQITCVQPNLNPLGCCQTATVKWTLIRRSDVFIRVLISELSITEGNSESLCVGENPPIRLLVKQAIQPFTFESCGYGIPWETLITSEKANIWVEAKPSQELSNSLHHINFRLTWMYSFTKSKLIFLKQFLKCLLLLCSPVNLSKHNSYT